MRVVNILRVLILLLLPMTGMAQRADTTYFDWGMAPSDFSSAEYYRVTQKVDRRLWKCEDHYMRNDKLQMTGYYSNALLDWKDGMFVYYDKKGNKKSEGKYVNNLKEGIFTDYNADGSIDKEGPYYKNKKSGEWKEYYDSTAKVWAVEQYSNDELISLKSYYSDGKLKRVETHNKDVISGNCYDEQGKDIPFTQFRIMPKCGFDMMDYLGSSIHYPEYARKHNISGRIIVKFVVNEDGHISDAEVIQGIGGGCDEEARRVVANMPNWVPGIRDDKMVKVYYTQPISFKLR
ncbi:MAG: hypothetical protein JWQ38_2314 [Flavipsychrobacter sp.]|nr:hypothetical protein [Flavipsychrobacter sp.]